MNCTALTGSMLAAFAVTACQPGPPPPQVRGGNAATALTIQTVASTGSVEIVGEVWADNWFALSANGTLIAEDSVPITTERSFNAERFTFRADLPLTLAFVVKDFKQDDTGLEYIGTGRQQMGDGGFIAQFTDANGRVIATTGDNWKCLVIHDAPLDRACAASSSPQPGVGACAFSTQPEPAGWQEPGFDDSSWPNATVYSAAQVDPKGGYDFVDWSPQAQLIWGPDLETNNTLLCRLTVTP